MGGLLEIMEGTRYRPLTSDVEPGPLGEVLTEAGGGDDAILHGPSRLEGPGSRHRGVVVDGRTKRV